MKFKWVSKGKCEKYMIYITCFSIALIANTGTYIYLFYNWIKFLFSAIFKISFDRYSKLIYL